MSASGPKVAQLLLIVIDVCAYIKRCVCIGVYLYMYVFVYSFIYLFILYIQTLFITCTCDPEVGKYTDVPLDGLKYGRIGVLGKFRGVAL